jgi:hypothetical protein
MQLPYSSLFRCPATAWLRWTSAGGGSGRSGLAEYAQARISTVNYPAWFTGRFAISDGQQTALRRACHRARRPACGRPAPVAAGSPENLQRTRQPLDLNGHPVPLPEWRARPGPVPAPKMSLPLSQAERCLNLSRQDYDARSDCAVYASSRFFVAKSHPVTPLRRGDSEVIHRGTGARAGRSPGTRAVEAYANHPI